MKLFKATILAFVAVMFLLSSNSAAYAQSAPGVYRLPTLENVQTELPELLGRLHLTHAQHEQVERIIANETFQLALTRGNSNLSVAKIFSQENAIRIQTRRQIAALLTARQAERVAKWVIHELKERERWGEDRTEVFSIPAAY
jgi:hypothetical protein